MLCHRQALLQQRLQPFFAHAIAPVGQARMLTITDSAKRVEIYPSGREALSPFGVSEGTEESRGCD
jgi:hypothetical protein